MVGLESREAKVLDQREIRYQGVPDLFRVSLIDTGDLLIEEYRVDGRGRLYLQDLATRRGDHLSIDRVATAMKLELAHRAGKPVARFEL